jgi:hypothetical protein
MKSTEFLRLRALPILEKQKLPPPETPNPIDHALWMCLARPTREIGPAYQASKSLNRPEITAIFRRELELRLKERHAVEAAWAAERASVQEKSPITH